MNDISLRMWSYILVLIALGACETEPSQFELRRAALQERENGAREAAGSDFSLAQDLNELDLANLYSSEVAQLLAKEELVWLSTARDIDIELAGDGHYLLSFEGPWSSDFEYYVFLTATEEQVKQFLGKPPEDRRRAKYLVALRLRTVSKPRLEVGSEVVDYDEMGAISEVSFRLASVRILNGDLLKAYEY